jgi:predicted amidohydrolase
MSSILLRSGLMIDGLDNPPFKGHVFIEGDRIKDVLRDADALPMVDTVIDATDCAISPGFIFSSGVLEFLSSPSIAINEDFPSGTDGEIV